MVYFLYKNNYERKIFMSTFEKYAWIFFVYSIGGWFMESFRGWIRTGKFVNRGFLIGPCIPIYGWGIVLLTYVLEDNSDDIVVLFLSSIMLCRNARIRYKLGNGKNV